ncbi:MAG: circadian clock protein KaiB [Rhodospirillales bacterium]|nr:circadian clock protein KaiB [Rhodospirillales bacterium]
MNTYVLKLYIAGHTPRTQQAILSLKDICENELGNQYELIVVDVLERPHLAEDEKILATPMLVKELPPPLRRVVGDLSNRELVLIGLDIAEKKPL